MYCCCFFLFWPQKTCKKKKKKVTENRPDAHPYLHLEVQSLHENANQNSNPSFSFTGEPAVNTNSGIPEFIYCPTAKSLRGHRQEHWTVSHFETL